MPNVSVFYVDPNMVATNAANGQPRYTGVSLPTSTQATPIPILWGTRRITPNIIWQSSTYAYYNTNTHVLNYVIVGTQAAQAHHWETAFTDSEGGPPYGGFYTPAGGSQSGLPNHVAICARVFGSVTPLVDTMHSGITYGSSDSSSTDCRWWVPMIMALCEGPINTTFPIWSNPVGIGRVWYARGTDPSTVWANGAFQESLGQRPWGLFYEVFTGTSTQTPWGLFAANATIPIGSTYPSQNLAYNSTAYVASAWVDCGHDGTPPAIDFEVCRTPSGGSYVQTDSYGLGYDYNLAAIIPDFLTNSQYGMGIQSGFIDNASLTAFFEYQSSLGLYFSPLLAAQSADTDIIDRWALISNSWIFFDGTVFRFVPLGDEALTGNGQTYTPDQTPAYNLLPGDFEAPGITVDRADPIDCYNRLRIEYFDRLNNYAKVTGEWKDTTLFNLVGIRDASRIKIGRAHV